MLQSYSQYMVHTISRLDIKTTENIIKGKNYLYFYWKFFHRQDIFKKIYALYVPIRDKLTATYTNKLPVSLVNWIKNIYTWTCIYSYHYIWCTWNMIYMYIYFKLFFEDCNMIDKYFRLEFLVELIVRMIYAFL